jgi:hypothetical protein
VRPADPDDIDARFEALVAQFDKDEIQRMIADAERDRTGEGGRARAPIIMLALAALLVLVGLVGNLRPDVLGKLGSLRSAGAATPAPQPLTGRAAGILPARTTMTGVDDAPPQDDGPTLVPPPSDPFAGSPAAGFADGEKGIVLPQARALGGLSRAQVSAALRRVRRLVVAARLAPETVRGKKPDAFIKLLDARQRAFFVAHLDKGGRKSNTRGWLFSLKPGTADLTTETVKADGETTLAARHGKDGLGGVTITADYLFVHAVNRPGDPATVKRLVEHYKGRFFAFLMNGRLVVRLDRSSAGTAGASCGVDDGFIHPQFADDAQKVRPTGAPVDPYDRKRDVEQDACMATGGT